MNALFLRRAVDVGETVTVVGCTAGEWPGLEVRYVGPSGTFTVEDVWVGAASCFMRADAIAAETLNFHHSEVVPAGTEVRIRVRNIGAAPATFVALAQPP
jgi:hypothetical protein